MIGLDFTMVGTSWGHSRRGSLRRSFQSFGERRRAGQRFRARLIVGILAALAVSLPLAKSIIIVAFEEESVAGVWIVSMNVLIYSHSNIRTNFSPFIAFLQPSELVNLGQQLLPLRCPVVWFPHLVEHRRWCELHEEVGPASRDVSLMRFHGVVVPRLEESRSRSQEENVDNEVDSLCPPSAC